MGAQAGEGRPGQGGKWELNGERELWRAGQVACGPGLGKTWERELGRAGQAKVASGN
jgi:hypothetical protein